MFLRTLPAVLLSIPLLACGDEADPKPGDGGPVQPDIVTEAVAYEHDGTGLEGYLAYDAGAKGKQPGVLVVHEWWGLADHPKERARRLAAMGYVAFCLDMYGKGKLTDDPEQAGAWAKAFKEDPGGFGRGRLLAGLEVLKKNPRVDVSRIAAIGFCYGGTVALELAWSGADVKGVVCFHGSLTSPSEEDAEDVKAHVLVLNGAADAWVPPANVAAFEQAMDDAGVEARVVNYEGAVHAFTNPGADARGMDNVKYDAKADKASWEEMSKFFRTLLGP